MALDKLTLLDETIINNSATSAATIVVNNSAQTNYISFAVATASPTSNGWRTYNDGAATSPVDGVSGTVNSTLTQNTSLPLNSTGDFRLTKNSGASRQGEGISTDFTIANRHLGKVLQVSFDYEVVSGTLATDDIRLYVIQSPSSSPVVIEPVGVSLQGTVSGTRLRHLATFQTHISITSYRLCIHIATTTNSLQVIDFNNFRVWEPTQSIGSIITDWTSYTPTFDSTNLGNSPTGVDFKWQRVGKNLKIIGRLSIGTAGSGIGTFTLPNGLVPDLSYTSGDGVLVGFLVRGAVSESSLFSLLARNDNLIRVGSNVAMNSTVHNPLVANNAQWFSNGNLLNLSLEVPILGWGSSVSMSSDSGDSRLVSMIYLNHGTTTTTGGTNGFRYSVLQEDTHSIYNTSTGAITIPINGTYSFKISALNSTGANGIYLWRSRGGGAITKMVFMGVVNTNGDFAEAQFPCLAGDIMYVSANSATTFTPATQTDSYISVSRLSAGSQVIATTETVSASYYSLVTQSTLTTQINFGGIIYDTHGAVTTGSSWKFTAPMSGKYLVTYNLGASTTSNQYIEVWKSGSLFRRNITGGINSASFQLNLLAGEYFDLRPNTSMTVSGSSGNDGNRSFIEITRIGN